MARAGGPRGAYVVDIGTGERLRRKADVARMPASVEKLYTSATAMLRYGAEGTLTTGAGRRRCRTTAGTIAGDVVLRGGGDPTFNATAAAALAEQLARRRPDAHHGPRDRRRVRVRRLPRPAVLELPTSSDVGPLSALAFNHGRTGKRRPYFQASPPRFAAEAFAGGAQARAA